MMGFGGSYIATANQVAPGILGPDSRVDINIHSYNSVTQGTWAYLSNASYYDYTIMYNGGSLANGDEIVYNVHLSAGTYTLEVTCNKGDAAGIMKVYLDTTVIATNDLYAAAVSNGNRLTTTAIAVASNGMYSLKMKVEGKNAASTGYALNFSTISMWRTA